MARDTKDDDSDKKPGLPGGFFLFLLLAFSLVAGVQHYVSTNSAKVSFSYQLEHLVNLDLILPDHSTKTAWNDNLVTFSGQFREREGLHSAERFKYLSQLAEQAALKAKMNRTSEQLEIERAAVREAADWFVHLHGQALPEIGLKIVDENYDLPGRENRLVVRTLSDRQVYSLAQLKNLYTSQSAHPDEKALAIMKDAVRTVVRDFRSPVLGIGDEEMKSRLRKLEEALSGNETSLDMLKTASLVISTLEDISESLLKTQDGIVLSQLRSVRELKDSLTELRDQSAELDEKEEQLAKSRKAVENVVWYFNNLELSAKSLERQDPEAYAHWFAKAKEEWEGFSINKAKAFKAPDQPSNLVLEKNFKSQEPAPNYFSYFLTVLPVLLVLGLLYVVFSRQMKGAGTGAMSFGKSPARLMNKENNKITFSDVAGIDEAKEELEEIVQFLKNPGKFTALGAKIPKGVLCIGPPGTGKTLIAKAVAGEAERPFFSISGSDFVEMFVGVGASRIRDMFDQAKKHAPCIIFIDEIDAVGRHRGVGMGGGHDEREQTLNQLLVEMDGFDSNEGVILMAATNRPDVLDKALLRPGRFDRRIVIDLPDIKGRCEILKVHAKRIKLDSSVDLKQIARMTAGSSGADLANLLNEAALLAARKNKTVVTAIEVHEAADKVRYGKERRSMELGEDEKRTTAYHESGHAVVSLIVEHSDPIDKVTIIPRGFSLGATHFLPEKNRVSYWRKELVDQLAVLMGGRIAEDIFIRDISSGAQQDIKMATQIARNMVCKWGMSDILGTVAYDDNNEGAYAGFGMGVERAYSPETAKRIDEEMRRLLDEANLRARDVLSTHADKVQLMTDMLMEFETLDSEDVKLIIGGTWDAEAKRHKLESQENYRKTVVPKPATSDNSGQKLIPDPHPAI